MCKGNTPLHYATNYLYRLFFSPPSFHFFHILSPTSTCPRLTISLLQAQCCISVIHTNSQENQSWSQIYLKVFWHTSKPKAMPCHGTWTQQPLFLFTAAFWNFQSKEFLLQDSQHRISCRKHFQSNLSLRALACPLLLGLSGSCSLHEETFPGLKTEAEDSV